MTLDYLVSEAVGMVFLLIASRCSCKTQLKPFSCTHIDGYTSRLIPLPTSPFPLLSGIVLWRWEASQSVTSKTSENGFILFGKKISIGMLLPWHRWPQDWGCLQPWYFSRILRNDRWPGCALTIVQLWANCTGNLHGSLLISTSLCLWGLWVQKPLASLLFSKKCGCILFFLISLLALVHSWISVPLGNLIYAEPKT